jgi:RNA polymerase-binding transcription factor DksA
MDHFDVRHGDMADQATMNHLVHLELTLGPLVAERRNEQKFVESNGIPAKKHCSVCGESIPRNRLIAKPFAIRCRNCEEQLEFTRR